MKKVLSLTLLLCLFTMPTYADVGIPWLVLCLPFSPAGLFIFSFIGVCTIETIILGKLLTKEFPNEKKFLNRSVVYANIFSSITGAFLANPDDLLMARELLSYSYSEFASLFLAHMIVFFILSWITEFLFLAVKIIWKGKEKKYVKLLILTLLANLFSYIFLIIIGLIMAGIFRK